MPSDVVSLFKPGDKGPAAQVRQGVVEAWNTSTGNNTIRVAGGELLNVPALTGESASLKAGDVVALLSAGNRWFLLGRVTTPGDPGTVPTWTADITALTGQVDTIQTVTIPAVQNDVTVVQGDVIELNTVTVPAVQAVADAAQSTATGAAADAAAAQAAADAAQADADSLQTDLDAAEASITTLTGTTIPGLAADIAAAQADVDAILPITTTDISDDAITTPKIAAGQITAVKIAADTITASQIAASAITASELAANAVTAGKIAAGTIVAADIAANTITAAKIAGGTITATELAAGAVTAAKLDAAAITGKTITGGLFRTDVSGQRVEIDSVSAKNEIRFYSGAATETSPATVNSQTAGGNGLLNLKSPAFSGSPVAQMTLLNFTSGSSATISATNTTLSANSQARLQAGAQILQVDTGGVLDFNGAVVVTDATVFPYYYAWIDSGQPAGASGTSTTITSHTTEGSPFNSGITHSAGVFTVPIAGRYRMTGQLYWPIQASPVGKRICSWALVSPLTTLVSHTAAPSALAEAVNHAEKTVRLAAGNQLIFRFTQTSGASLAPLGTTRDLSFINIEYVGP